MNWLVIALGGYFINAGVYVGDKFLLSKKIHSSIAYAFYVGIWSIFNIFILFLAPWIPSWQELALDLSAGFLFLVTLVFWYKALHQSEATRVVPIVGALIPVFSFFLSFLFLGQELTERQFLAFLILICGGILISIKHTRFYVYKEMKEKVKLIFGDTLGQFHAHYRPSQRLIVNSVVSAFLFASYYVLIKYIYTHQPFIGSFVWSRMGSFLGAVLILVIPAWRSAIVKYQKNKKTSKNFGLFLLVRVFATAAFIMLNYAISIGNVALINSLQGVQYIFLIGLVIFLSAKYPKVLQEELFGTILMQKIMGTVLISIGLYMLVVS